MADIPRLPQQWFPVADAGLFISDLFTPTLRLGVTGLSRSGKTVFITALVACLTGGGARPPIGRLAGIPGLRAYLEPQPDDDVPRFAYEEHLAALTSAEPKWPEGTRRISQLRLTLEWEAQDFARRALGLTPRLHIDIVDYPGEWLTDLALLDQSYSEWAADALAYARSSADPGIAKPFLRFAEAHAASEEADEQVAIEGARLFTDYLGKARASEPSRAVLGPGRFLLPGDLAGSPLITFFPLLDCQGAGARAASLEALMARRFESYKTHVVKPFFEKHFSRLDRQIVLIDLLSALNGGAKGISDLEHGLEGVLRAFRPGAHTWLSLILPRRIDRIAFAATKADHVHVTSHASLAAILSKAVARAARRCDTAGAETASFALAAYRATEDVDKTAGNEVYRCIRGRPQAGEVVDGVRFDGTRRAVVFPGDLPRDPLDAFDPDVARPERYSFVRFAPPERSTSRGGSAPDGSGAAPGDWPHIGLDRVFAFLFGDHLP